ncbi:hypothetical protein PMAYCL1PPCAC_04144, partial [Pristionchus mayeri]
RTWNTLSHASVLRQSSLSRMIPKRMSSRGRFFTRWRDASLIPFKNSPIETPPYSSKQWPVSSARRTAQPRPRKKRNDHRSADVFLSFSSSLHLSGLIAFSMHANMPTPS